MLALTAPAALAKSAAVINVEVEEALQKLYKAKPETNPRVLAKLDQMRQRLDEISEAQDVVDRIERLREEGKYPPAPAGTNRT